jgi:hypothetical protein
VIITVNGLHLNCIEKTVKENLMKKEKIHGVLELPAAFRGIISSTMVKIKDYTV